MFLLGGQKLVYCLRSPDECLFTESGVTLQKEIFSPGAFSGRRNLSDSSSK